MVALLTSTSFMDTPGNHQKLLEDTGFKIDTLRGPVKEKVLLPIIAKYDGIICGDDEITEKVIKIGAENKLKIISKYGIGLDKIDLQAAKFYNIPVTNCPGVNHITVAEHVIALILAFYKNIPWEYNITKSGKWKRLIGHEIYGKKLGVIGLGKIGKEVALRAKAFGLKIYTFDKNIDNNFVKDNNIRVCEYLEDLLHETEIISLNLPLTNETKGIISLDNMKNDINNKTLLINTARAGLIDLETIIFGLENKILSGYLTDVLEEEPMRKDHPLLKYENVIITPHIGSRTYESVERQGIMAVQNLVKYLK